MSLEAVPKALLSADPSCQCRDSHSESCRILGCPSHHSRSHPFQALSSHLERISRKLAVQVNYQQQGKPLTEKEKKKGRGGEIGASKNYGAGK